MPQTPYMKLYIGDYLGDTSHLSALQHGAYLLLIMAYWQRGGPLRNTDVLLSNIARTTPVEWAECRETILEFFEERDGYLYHKRIERELHKRAEISEKCKEAVGKRWNERNTDVLPTNNGRNTTPIVHRSIDPEEENTEEREAPVGAGFEVVEVLEPKPSPPSSPRAKKPAERDPLRDALAASFKAKVPEYGSPAKENANLLRLASAIRRRAAADQVDETAAAQGILETFWRLHESGKQFYADFTPSKALAAFEGLWAEYRKGEAAKDVSWVEGASA